MASGSITSPDANLLSLAIRFLEAMCRAPGEVRWCVWDDIAV